MGKDECITSKFKVDDKVQVKIIDIDFGRKKIDVSIKRLTKTPELDYFETNYNRLVEVEVTKVVPEKGIAIKYPDGTNTGFIHWFEIGWGSVGKFETLFNKGDKLNAILYEFDTERNSLKFSIKRQYKHQFKEWLDVIDENEVFRGKVIKYFENSVQIELTQKNLIVQAFVLRKDISNLAFVEQSDLQYYLPINEYFSFYISEINETIQTISLTRAEYLKQAELPKFGQSITVKYVKENHSKGYFYSDEIEGWTNLPDNNISFGTDVEVLLISSTTREFTIVESNT